ncbi:PHA/PHB synthase family protein [Croceicoccus esteveae]
MMAGPFASMMAGPMKEMVAMQSSAAQAMFNAMLGTPEAGAGGDKGADAQDQTQEAWQQVSEQLADMWARFLEERPGSGDGPFADPARWMELATGWMSGSALSSAKAQQRFMSDSIALWQSVLGQYGLTGDRTDEDREQGGVQLPRSDRRFKDDKWREQPLFAMLHQAYLLMAEQMLSAADKAEGLPADRKAQMQFFTRLVAESLSPAHFPLTNPLVIERTLETGGKNLLRGMQHLIADLKAGQLSHTDKQAFEVGVHIAATPGKVVHETPLFQLIQYTPTTKEVLKTPLVIFPPWINRFYILDLGEKKSFVRWAVEQGLTVFIVSWKSADAAMAELTWSDYVRAQIEAVDLVRARLKVPAVHTVGYCVAGTTLAATLAVLARRKEEERVASATFFTAQVDFSEAGELKAFIDDQQLAMVDALASDGVVDGRYLAAAFNLLRSPDLIWNYVIDNYLLGKEYRAFDLLHWNGDVTNLPARWHREYLKDLYKDNRLVQPDSMVVDNTPVDLRLIKTPCYIQAGREDHIAPPQSVWKMTGHLSGPVRFMLAGSGHIAGVVNPPESGKYQYWTLDDEKLPDTLDAFCEQAQERPGSWWGDWIDWIRSQDETTVAATGRRKPGGKNDAIIEDAPGRYVKTR